MGHKTCVFADNDEAVATTFAGAIFRNDREGLHDIVQAIHRRLIAVLRNQNNPGVDIAGRVEMGKGRFVAVKLHDAGRDHHRNADGVVGDTAQVEPFEHGVILLFQRVALAGGQNAGRVIAVVFLPGRH